MAWPLPIGAEFVHEGTVGHPRDGHHGHYWRLARFGGTGVYVLVGMMGEVRSCPQGWARQQAQAVKGGDA